MKELIFKKLTGQGIADGVLRVIGRFLFFKYTDSAQTRQVIENFRSKGVGIWEGKGWIKVDLIGDNEVFRLGEHEYIVNEISEEAMENVFFNFYMEQYKKMGFYVKETQYEN